MHSTHHVICGPCEPRFSQSGCSQFVKPDPVFSPLAGRAFASSESVGLLPARRSAPETTLLSSAYGRPRPLSLVLLIRRSLVRAQVGEPGHIERGRFVSGRPLCRLCGSG
jgi:hypothetical protein